MITAVIPTRKGSTRLPNKNVLDFKGEPLLVRKIRQLKESRLIDRIIVASDSAEYLNLASSSGVKSLMMLPDVLTGDNSSFSDLVAHVADQFIGDILAWTPCTAPLVDAPMYDAILDEWRRDDYDSCIMVSPERRYTMRDGKPLNYVPGPGHVYSQNMPPLHVWSGAMWAASAQDMVKWRYFHGPTPQLFEIPKHKAVDIDDAYDLAQAIAWSEL